MTEPTDPIGTAQERELINYLCRSTASPEEEQAADALLSRIAEVAALREALQFYRDEWVCASPAEKAVGFDLAPTRDLECDAGEKASAALSQHRKL